MDERIESLLLDRRWRINHLYWIEDEQGRKIRFRMNAVQERFFRRMWWLNVVLKSRQHGMSTLINLLQLDECLFNSHLTCGIVDKTDRDACRKLGKIQFAYDHLDDPEDPVIAPLGARIKELVRVDRRNDHELSLSNDSKIWCGTSLRGGTVQFLHISELGPIAYNSPKRSEEIRTGALNTVHAGAKVAIESTHEGGRTGLNYEMIETARAAGAGDDLTQMDWRFHFYPWYLDPKNAQPVPASGYVLTEDLSRYFRELEEAEDITLSPEQRLWYAKKFMTQRDAMWREHPSTVDEALNAVVRGAIYGRIISELRRTGRVREFAPDKSGGRLVTAWDLGQSDFAAIWLIQLMGPEIGLLRYYSARGEHAKHYASTVQDWELEYGPISVNLLPHDAAHRVGPGVTWVKGLEDAGLKRIRVVPRTPDIWIGINHLRGLLERSWIHSVGCGTEWKTITGELVPSGLACLEGYHTAESSTSGRVMELPVHDETSHGCDALRTYAEAHQRGMIDATAKQLGTDGVGRVKVLTGIRSPLRTGRKGEPGARVPRRVLR